MNTEDNTVPDTNTETTTAIPTEGAPADGAPVVETTPEGGETKKKRGRGGNRNQRKPSLKDWIRVQKSQSNGLDNVHVKLVINTATGLAELVTVAPKQEGSAEMEQPRTQVFRIHEYEVINDPNRNPLAAAEEPAAEGAAAGDAAPATEAPAVSA